jgi:DNA-binding response OmpR family regulator
MELPQRILVADDDSEIRRLNAEVPKRAGCHLATAENGDADVKVLRAASYAPDSYDLLMTDRDLPGMSVLYLVKKPRAAHMAL